MKVSVVIPTYNEERAIGGCLESLSKQTYKDMEIIVVDDGSSDNTVSIVRNFQFSIFNFQLLRQEHKGPGEARNLGVEKATGEILVFVDADMTFDEEFTAKLVEPILKGKARGTFSREEYVSNWDNIWARCWNINEGWEEKKRHPKNYPDHQRVFRAILKSEFDRISGFEKGGYYTDDWSLSKKLGYEAIAAPGAKFYHKNPETLLEIFNHSQWVAKRSYKLGIVGIFIALFRLSLPISVLVGVVKAIVYTNPHFIVFKLIYDFGAFWGMIKFLFSGSGAK